MLRSFLLFFFSPAGVAFILGPFLILWVSGREDGAAVKESSSSAQPHSHEEATFTHGTSPASSQNLK